MQIKTKNTNKTDKKSTYYDWRKERYQHNKRGRKRDAKSLSSQQFPFFKTEKTTDPVSSSSPEHPSIKRVGNNYTSLFIYFLLFSTMMPTSSAMSSHADDVVSEAAILDPYQQQKALNNESLLALTNLIRLKIQIDPSIKDKSVCDTNLVNNIVQTTVAIPASKGVINRIIHNSACKIKCTTAEWIQQRKGYASALFSPTEKTMYLPNDSNEGLIYHEATHAAMFFAHNTKSCPGYGEEVDLLPFYPPTEEGFDTYEAALNIGDARIEEFAALYEKERLSESLTPEECIQLESYKEAARDCYPAYVIINKPISDPDYHNFSKLLARWQKVGPEGLEMVFGKDNTLTMTIMDIKQTDKDTITINMRYKDPILSVINLPEKIRSLLEENYKDESYIMKLVERDAYTFEHLSAKACLTFYHEAHKIRRDTLKKCDPEPKNRPSI